MAFNIEIDDKVTFKVKGTINNAAGKPVAFDFAITANRLDTDEFKAAIERGDGEGSLIGFITDVATGWAGVNDGAGKPVEFSADALGKVCRVPGMATLIFKAYTAEVGAKEKN